MKEKNICKRFLRMFSDSFVLARSGLMCYVSNKIACMYHSKTFHFMHKKTNGHRFHLLPKLNKQYMSGFFGRKFVSVARSVHIRSNRFYSPIIVNAIDHCLKLVYVFFNESLYKLKLSCYQKRNQPTENSI